MKIINKDLLKPGKAPRRCETCSRASFYAPLAPHHIYFRGLGGANRLDVSINLIWLCNDCHREAHSERSKEFRQQCLEIVARRERCKPIDIAAVIEAVIRLPKNPTVKDVFTEAFTFPTASACTMFAAIVRKHCQYATEEWESAMLNVAEQELTELQSEHGPEECK